MLDKTIEYQEFIQQVESEGGVYIDNCSCTPCCCARCNVDTYEMPDGQFRTFNIMKKWKDESFRCEKCRSILGIDQDYFRPECGEWLCESCYEQVFINRVFKKGQ